MALKDVPIRPALRHKVTIERGTESQNEYGEARLTWATLTTRRAFVRPLSGRERLLAEQVQSDVTHKVTMREYTGLTPRDRFVFDSRTLNIVSVIEKSNVPHHMEVMCREETDA